MPLQNHTVVVIEDDASILETIEKSLSLKYENVLTYNAYEPAIDELHRTRPDVILLDTFIGHTNGLDVLDLIKKQGYSVPIVLMTAFTDLKMAVHGMKLGAEDFIVKPIDIDQLEVSIHRAIQHYEIKKRLELLAERMKATTPETIIGDSAELKKALDMSAAVSKADTTVLLYGESGTGKELFAKFIHDNSNRAKGPFMTINCGAIPRDIAENELFGYERGAFTGAVDKVKHGKFEQAHHGTILFDEISELSLDLQVKLLRVLQEKKYYRLGGAHEITVDVRVIAATNKDLEPLVSEGKFREDLYYRLNVAKVELPPLRDRGNDVITIASSFIAEFNKEFAKRIEGFTPQALQIMNNYPWRGNVRELRNAMERVVLLEHENLISTESLAFLKTSLVAASGEKLAEGIRDGEHKLYISKSGTSYNSVIRDLIIQTMRLTKGDESKASKILGLTTLKLKERFEQLEIKPTDYS
jgi:DNA-binding NtrC family response regulator